MHLIRLYILVLAIVILVASCNSRDAAISHALDPVADLHIAPVQSMDIDAGNRRIIAVNPNSDTENLMVYDLPDYIAEP